MQARLGAGAWAGLAWFLGFTAVAAEPLTVSAVADGVYVHYGVQEDSGPGNLGDIANLGFIVGERCVAVVDTGGTAEVGRRLRAAVRRVTPLPVCYVINTHVHPDHIFGNAAFEGDQPTFVGHAKLPQAMAARGGTYVHALERDFGAVAQGSRVIAPTTLVQTETELDLGGRVLKLRAWPTAHTDNDLTVFDAKTGTLFLSDLLFVERIPVVDGSLRGWLAIQPQIVALQPARAIPGHGMVKNSLEDAVAAQERYLSTLRKEVKAAIKEGMTLRQAVDRLGTSEQGKWLLWDSFHKRNVTAAYAELEWED